MNAREFLAQKQGPFVEREVTKQPLSEAEVRALAKRLGGIRELVAPKRREELAPLSDEELVKHLASTPGHLRRPIIDTGSLITAGFTAATRAQLEGGAPAPAKPAQKAASKPKPAPKAKAAPAKKSAAPKKKPASKW